MLLSKLRRPRLTVWQRCLLIGLVTALAGQFYLSAWAEGFRVSAAAILYPVLLVTVMRDSHRPESGLSTALCVTGYRTLSDLFQGFSLGEALLLEYPGGVFYLCYDILLCLLIRDRRSAAPVRLWLAFFSCDFLSNLLNLVLSRHLNLPSGKEAWLSLLWLAFGRSLAAATLLWASQRYRQLLLREEHEQRYHRLFLMTAELKTELYFLKKDAEDIEQVMTHAYQLYEKLEEANVEPELSALALSIARDVHEVKKDNLRIIRGIEEEVAESYDQESMALSDLLHILEVSTRQFLGEQRADIRLECSLAENPSIREHYRLLSILKNLVTNAVEAILSTRGRGVVRVDSFVRDNTLHLTVSDDGPGISTRAQRLLFQVGYSTKFNPETGDINRGVGLPAVQYIIQELGGQIQLQSQLGQGTEFHIQIPLPAVTGGSHADLRH